MVGKWLKASSILLGLFAVVIIYAVWIEPYWLEVTRCQVTANVTQPLTVVHLTDLHIGSEGALERKVLAAVERERPDLIVVTGDNVTEDGRFDEAAKFLARLRAPLGAFGVEGNWEHWTRDRGTPRVIAALS